MTELEQKLAVQVEEQLKQVIDKLEKAKPGAAQEKLLSKGNKLAFQLRALKGEASK